MLAGTAQESTEGVAGPKRSKLRLVDRRSIAVTGKPSAKEMSLLTASQTYMKELIEYLTPDSRKKLIDVVNKYQQNGNLTALIEQLKAALLPTHPKLFRGFATFLNAKHQKIFSEVCNQILQQSDADECIGTF